jgi:predicted acetyltransferase
MSASSIEILPAEGELAEAMVRAAGVPFSFSVDDEEMARIVASFEPGRYFVPVEDGKAVGSSGSVRYDVTVPGGARLGTAGVTFVTVLPTHRRSGILRRLMRKITDGAHERGEPLAALGASEATIYGRFGYGQAVPMVEWRLDSTRAEWRSDPPGGRLDLVGRAEARRVLPALHRAACSRHGMFTRSDFLWDTYELEDESWMRNGHSERRIGIYRGDAGPEGYLFFRTKLEGRGLVRVTDMIAVTGDAYRALVGFAADIDLTQRVRFHRRPTDEPMRWMLVDSRSVRMVETEYMWFALIDLRAALEARTYEADGRVVLDVTDPFCPWNQGRWLLEVDAGRAVCRPTSAAPDVSLPVSELAALYMGGRSALPMVAAGRIDASPEAAVQLDAMFRTRVPPWSLEYF